LVVTDLIAGKRTLASNTVEELLQMADEFDAMAARAATPDARQALERVATRFRIFAAARPAHGPDRPLTPGAPAPAAGIYELRNVHGTQAGDIVQVARGELLPRAPSAFTWHLTRQVH
jgi:hypothetical protein